MATDRDICFSFWFTYDDRRIIYLRETRHGSEMYHLFELGLSEGTLEVSQSRDLMTAHPQLTCAVGFVGGMQLWLSPSRQTDVVLATGTGSLLWDLSQLDLTSGELRTLYKNPASGAMGCVGLVISWLVHIFLRGLLAICKVATLGFVNVSVDHICPAPAVPLQYFVDKDGLLVGAAECAVSLSISLRFSLYDETRKTWRPVGSDIPFEDLNMQLVGSGGAAGTMRLDIDSNTSCVCVHTCAMGDTTAYVEYPTKRILAQHPKADIESFISNPIDGTVEAVVVYTSRRELIPVSRSGEKLIRQLRKLGHCVGCKEDEGGEIALASRTVDDSVWIVRKSSDKEPGIFYLVKMPFEEEVSVPRILLRARPQLSKLPLAWSSHVEFPSRDGETLCGYLTLPISSSGASPLVLIPHGGPSARTFRGYDPVVQLLAARGIASLSVNYRGSTGYGMRFLRLGCGNLQRMHNDIEDARMWAIDNKIAEISRIAIVGASWGGYLALGAATGLCQPRQASEGREFERAFGDSNRHPYAAVVAIVPPATVGASNNSSSFRGDPLVASYWKQIYGKAVSKNKSDAEALSPLYHLSLLHGTKLLLVHGEEDPRVPLEHGDAVARASRQLGVVGAHVIYSHEGHSIRREPNVLHMWHLIETFLCGCLDLPAPPAVDARAMEGNTANVRWDAVGLTDTNCGAYES